VRGILLKGNSITQLPQALWPMLFFYLSSVLLRSSVIARLWIEKFYAWFALNVVKRSPTMQFANRLRLSTHSCVANNKYQQKFDKFQT